MRDKIRDVTPEEEKAKNKKKMGDGNDERKK